MHAPSSIEHPQPVTFGLIGELAQDPSRIAIAVLPMLVTIVALIAPTSLITHAIVQERETRTLELLVALPVRIQQVIAAKLTTAFLFSLSVCGGCASILCVELLALGIATPTDVFGIAALLVAALGYATASSLLVAILAKDFRTANNLAGAVIGPAILVVVVGTAVLSGVTRPLALALLFSFAAMLLARTALRTATFERLLD
jgi:ABC-type Na+ efflux pump permease subunit